MHLALLPWLLLALAGGASNGVPAQSSGAAANTDFLHGLYSVAAQTAETATTTISATATTAVSGTATIAQSTPAPLATATAGGNLRINPFDWNFLTSVPDPALGPFGWVYIVVMLALFGVSAYFYFFKRIEWKRTNSVLRRAAERWGQTGMWIAGLALLFAVFRVIKLDVFDVRFWFYLWLLAALGAALWFFYWYRTSYPKEMAKYLKTQRARQYMPGASKKVAVPLASTGQPAKPATSRPSSEGKRRKRR
jgi:preprotein translocase subunit SecY